MNERRHVSVERVFSIREDVGAKVAVVALGTAERDVDIEVGELHGKI
jgi:hypothetical protein